MRSIDFTRSLFSAGLVAFSTLPAASQEAGKAQSASSLRIEGSVGAEYDGNVAAPDLDTNTGKGDAAATIDFLVEATFKPVKKLILRGGYDFSQTLHDQFSAFDLQIHRGYGEVAYDFGIFTVGVLGNDALANLGGDKYLTYTQVSPYLSKQFGDKLFLRGSFASTDKSFTTQKQRDARSEAWMADAYVFLDGTKRYFILGAKTTSETAKAAELDYASKGGKIGFVQRFVALGRPMTVRLGADYEDRDYKNPTPSISARRADKRSEVSLSLETPIGKHAFAEASYKYGHYDSNLTAAKYNDQVGAVRVGFRF